MSESYFEDEFSLAAHTAASSAVPLPYDIESRSEVSSRAPVSFYEEWDGDWSIVSMSNETSFSFERIWSGGSVGRLACGGTHASSFRTNLTRIEEVSNSDLSSSNSLESSVERVDCNEIKSKICSEKQDELEGEDDDGSNFGGLARVGSSKENDLALCCHYIQTGKYEAALLKFQQLLTSESNIPAPKLASIYHNLGILHSKLNDLDAAVKYLHKSILIHNNLPKSHHLADTYIQLGFLHLKKPQTYRKSVQAFHEALRIRETLFGEHHPLTGKVHNHLGVAYLIRQKYPDANLHFKQCLQVQRIRLQALDRDTRKTNEIQTYKDQATLEIANVLCNIGAMATHFPNHCTPADAALAQNALQNALRIRLQLSHANHHLIQEPMQASLHLISALRQRGAQKQAHGLFSIDDALFYSQFFEDREGRAASHPNQALKNGNNGLEISHPTLKTQNNECIPFKVYDQTPKITPATQNPNNITSGFDYSFHDTTNATATSNSNHCLSQQKTHHKVIWEV